MTNGAGPCGVPTTAEAACLLALPRTPPAGPFTNHRSAHPGTTISIAYTPSQIRKAYGFPSTGGAGQTIALVDAFGDPTITVDLTVFSSTYNLPTCTVANKCLMKVSQTGTSTLPSQSAAWSMETSLDVEWTHAIAPNAKILLVEATTQSFSNLMTAVAYAASQAKYVSMSWAIADSSSATAQNSLFAAHPTVSFFASSGDAGGLVVYPSSSPYVVSVGGTSLHLTSTDTSVTSESPWVTGGGGCSRYESAPQAQLQFPTFDQTGALCPAGMRGTPDVAADADPTTGLSVYDTTPVVYTGITYVGWYAVGGTSASSPLWAARSADQGAVVNATYVYATGDLPFHNITSGHTGDGVSTGHPCLVGYSLCDGLGSWNSVSGVVYKEIGATNVAPAETAGSVGQVTVDLSSLAPVGGVAITASTTSSNGGFSLSASGPFSSSLVVSIAQGAHRSPPLYYRDLAVGNPTLTFSSPGWSSGHLSESIGIGALASLVLTPSSAIIAPNGSRTFTLSGYDAANNPVPINSTVTWSTTVHGAYLSNKSSRGVTFHAPSSPVTGTLAARLGALIVRVSIRIS